jgi:uncharacterized protein YggT (Ycf19 family)
VDIFFYIFAKLVSIILDAVMLAMVVRMLMPIFADVEGSRIYTFVCLLSEPFIIPIRFLLVKLNWLQNSPIDWSFTITYFVIVLIRNFLPII